ncbi:glycosyltransferase [Paraburkholderia tropica]|uniref:glycosyltransferase n=1 Tax=Paraburkholderia tropica TaxID=92647 RepID=UPI002AAFE968|nr:glycosyltransferase [Paraburkholderia tropica]
MRIALVTTTFSIGGAEKQVRDLASVFSQQGHQVLIVSLKGETQQEIPDGVELIELHGKKSLVGLVGIVWRLAAALRNWKPDVVHGHMVVANILSRIACLRSRSVVVVSRAHSVDEGGGDLRILAYRLTDRLADMTTNASQHAVNNYLKRKASKPGKICVASNGVDFDKYKFSPVKREILRKEFEISSEALLCLAVGRLVDAKDYPTLIDAFAKVVDVLPIAKLIIVGSGPMKDFLQQKIEILGISKSIQLIGMRTDIPELMSAADLFVLSSAWEGAPLVTIEALACQLPIVATDCGGVADNLNGFGSLVSVGDSAMLAEGIVDELRLKRVRTDSVLVEARRNAKARFSLAAVGNRWIYLYKILYSHKMGLNIR